MGGVLRMHHKVAPSKPADRNIFREIYMTVGNGREKGRKAILEFKEKDEHFSQVLQIF